MSKARSFVYAVVAVMATTATIGALLLVVVGSSGANAYASTRQFKDSTDDIKYYNLSCPFEWSKYSCAHQGKDWGIGPSSSPSSKAQRVHNIGRTLLFTADESPEDADRDLVDLDADMDGSDGDSIRFPSNSNVRGRVRRRHNGGRRILLIGDSLTRQVFISIACQLHSSGRVIDHAIDWVVPPSSWPCHGTPNCVPSGPHSGFNVASIKLDNGNEVHFLPSGGSLGRKERFLIDRLLSEASYMGRIKFGQHMLEAVREWWRKEGRDENGLNSNYMDEHDVLVINVGIHHHAKNSPDKLRQVVKLGQQLRVSQRPGGAPRLVYLGTPAQHYQTWESIHHTTGLFERSTGQCTDQGNGSSQHCQSNGCVASVQRNPRADLEWSMLPGGVDVLLEYGDLGFGGQHVGRVEDRLDCSHYCMPGPPDGVARRLMNAIELLPPRPRNVTSTALPNTASQRLQQ